MGSSWNDLPDEVVEKIMFFRAAAMYKDVMKSCRQPCTYVIHEDSRHAWLEVPLSELVKANLYRSISPYSYMCGSKAYLEEDCDWLLFTDHMKHIGVCSEYKNLHGHVPAKSAICGYRQYNPNAFIKGTRCLTSVC